MNRLTRWGFVAVLAMGLAALGGSTASASTIKAHSYPSSLEGTGGDNFELMIAGQNAFCQTPALSATLTAKTSVLAMTMADTTCTGLGPLKANGCKLIFTPGPNQIAGTVDGTASIGGTACTTGLTDTFGSCTLTVLPQTLDATLHNIGVESELGVALSTETLEYSSSSAACGEKGLHKNGHLSAAWTVKGTSGVYLEPDLTLVGEQVGIFMGAAPAFEAEKYPVLATGEQTNTQEMWLGGNAECSIGYFEAVGNGGGTTTSVVPSYGGCHTFGLKATVSMNGCHYDLHAAGSVDVICPKGPAEIKSYLFGTVVCTITIGSQYGRENVTYSTIGGGSGRGISATAKVTGLKYTIENSGCPEEVGTYENGTYTGSATLYGLH